MLENMKTPLILAALRSESGSIDAQKCPFSCFLFIILLLQQYGFAELNGF